MPEDENSHRATLLSLVEEQGAELRLLLDEVNSEISSFNTVRNTAGDSPFIRRTYVRTTFSCVEAYITHLKRSALMFATDKPELFSPEEILALRDKSSQVGNNGIVQTGKAKIRLRDNVLLAVKSFAKSFGNEANINYGDKQGRAFLKAIEIRNRITHPKSVTCWNVSDEDMETVKEAWNWFVCWMYHVAELAKRGAEPDGSTDNV